MHLNLITSLMILAAILLSSACGKPGKAPKAAPASLQERLYLYCELAEDPVDPHDGDSLFFTGFLRTACGGRNMDDYMSRPGRYQRWPVSTGIKYTDPNASGTGTMARSESSRDGYLAVMWKAWADADRQTLEDIRDWGQRRDWFMGDGRLFGVDTLFNLSLRSTLAEMIYRLGGENDLSERLLPVIWSECADFECWLLGAHLALRGDVYGALGSNALDKLDEARKRQPDNPLLELVWQRYSNKLDGRPLRLLLESRWHPEDRLPNDNDQCELWPYRRDPTSNSLNNPCPERGLTHSGGDWAFVAWLYQRWSTLDLTR